MCRTLGCCSRSRLLLLLLCCCDPLRQILVLGVFLSGWRIALLLYFLLKLQGPVNFLLANALRHLWAGSGCARLLI